MEILTKMIVLFFQVKFTKIFDLTDSENVSGKAHSECDDDQQLPFEPEWNAMTTTGTNCHECLELYWELDTVPRCVCFQNQEVTLNSN